jgi:hypothetical protein
MTGNFYSAQNPNWPPLPGNVWELSAWDLGDGFYLLNDLDLNYTQLQTASSATERTMAMNMSLLEGGGGLGLQAPQYTTNDLWLEIVTTNSAASLIVHSP